LKLDKPLILNFRNFRDYRADLIEAARVRARTREEIAVLLDELAKMEASPNGGETAERRRFFRYVTNRNMTTLATWQVRLGLAKGSSRVDFDSRLADPQKHASLAAAIRDYVQIWCEDVGQFGVSDAMALLQSSEVSRDEQRGLIECLNFMVVEPLRYTYSRDASSAETPEVLVVWQAWWTRNQARLPPLDPDRRATLRKNLTALAAAPTRTDLFRMVEEFQLEYLWDFPDMRFFAETLLGESTLEEKVVSAMILKLFVSNPLPLDLARNATDEQLDNRIENWKLAYESHRSRYEPGFAARLWSVVGDTQYAHMVWRLVTFQFGRSTLRTREPVSEKIWRGVKVSAPLMLMSSLLIYAVAIPIGLLCGVFRGRWIDHLNSLGLFLLYSVPPFVAGMLFLLYLSYGEYLKIFPMERLHGDRADQLAWLPWLWDYLWHATLPIICLSLFSLAPLAMYSRTSLLEVLGQDYIRTARAKGLSERRVILVHALRNALIPLITLAFCRPCSAEA
jgi:ABC-type dipeptide/oligopeptide/nickel transport system permease component